MGQSAGSLLAPQCCWACRGAMSAHVAAAASVLRVSVVLQAGILAAMALSLASRADLEKFGAADLIEALEDASCKVETPTPGGGDYVAIQQRFSLGHARIAYFCSDMDTY